MALKYKIDVLDSLKHNGFSTYRLRKEAVLSESAIQRIRKREALSWDGLNTICRLLNCQPGDILEYVPDETPLD